MSQQITEAFCCWSGGKDSTFALYRSLKNFKVTYLLNMISEDGKYSRSHGIKASLLKWQAETAGIKIIQRKSSLENYEKEFKKTILNLKTEKVTTGIFGDIDVQEHRDWIERVCQEAGITPVFPLWKCKREEIVNEFIQAGFKAIVVSTNAKFLGSEWLGRKIDGEFINDLKNLCNIDLCGEAGEYHTFVFNGPIFKNPLEFIIGEKKLKDNRWFLDIKKEG